MRYFVIIPAAGHSARFGGVVPKQYWMLCGKPVLVHSLDLFYACPFVEKMIVAISQADRMWPSLAQAYGERVFSVPGGEERFWSVWNALQRLSPLAQPHDWVLVHDAARPCLTAETLLRLTTTLEEHAVGGTLGIPVRDTLKTVEGGTQTIVDTLDRTHLWHAQTPQMFRFAVLWKAYTHVVEHNLRVTDESMAVEALGLRPRMVLGDPMNLKITHQEDIALAECIKRNV